jgi:phosphatidylinositol dimannoside acyltransferase
VRGYLVYFAYRLLAATAGRLPPATGYWLASQVSRLLYIVSPRLCSAVRSNMHHVLGADADPKRVREATRGAFTNIVKGHYDLFRMARLSTDEIKELTDVDGMDHLFQALSGGQGAVVVSAHLGNVDIVGQLPLVHGIQISGAVQHIQPEPLFRYLLKLRQSHGLRLIPNDAPLIGLFRALKRGEIIALPCDRDITDHGRVVEFFGTPARLPDGPIRVALRTGAPMIPAFAERLPDNTFKVYIEPPLELERTGDTEADIDRGMKLVVAAMERHISRDPAQWLVAAPVWPNNGAFPSGEG